MVSIIETSGQPDSEKKRDCPVAGAPEPGISRPAVHEAACGAESAQNRSYGIKDKKADGGQNAETAQADQKKRECNRGAETTVAAKSGGDPVTRVAGIYSWAEAVLPLLAPLVGAFIIMIDNFRVQNFAFACLLFLDQIIAHLRLRMQGLRLAGSCAMTKSRLFCMAGTGKGLVAEYAKQFTRTKGKSKEAAFCPKF